MRKLTHRDRAEQKLESMVWNLGREKGRITTIIKSLQETKIAKYPVILEAIKALEKERDRLNSISPV